MSTVTGTVEAKGEKFSGSVKVGGRWLNFKKGVDHSFIKVGDTVKLELKPWSFQGKSGESVAMVQLLGESSVAVAEKPEEKDEVIENPKAEKPAIAAYKVRDFDAEARGKTRCQMFSAALQSPVLQQYLYTKEATLDDIVKTLKEVADAGTDYTFGE